MIVRELIFKLGFSAQDAQRHASRFDKTVTGLKSNLIDMGKRAAIAAGVVAYGAFKMSDSYLLLQSRLQQVVKDQSELNAVSNELFQIAQRQRAPIEAVTDLYIKMRQATEDLAISQSDTQKVTEAFNASLILSGAKGPAAEAAILQFAQGLSSKKLSGDEYKTLRETNPQFLQALMKGSNKSRSELDAMAEGGQLTPEFIFKATLAQYDDLIKRSAEVRRSAPQAALQVMNSLSKRLGDLAKKSDAFNKVVKVFDRLREIIESPRFDRGIEGILVAFSALLDILVTLIDVLLRFIDTIDGILKALGGWERVIRLVGSAILIYLVRRMWMAVAAMWAYIASMGFGFTAAYAFSGAIAFLGKVLRALPLIFVLTMLALVIEDLWAFVQGNESVTGRLISAWSDYVWFFKETWNGVVTWFEGIYNKMFGWFDSMSGWASKIAGFFPSGSLGVGAAIGQQMVGGSAKTSNLSVKNEMTINVPVGTSAEQAEAINKQVRDAMNDQLLTTYRQTLNDFPDLEG